MSVARRVVAAAVLGVAGGWASAQTVDASRPNSIVDMLRGLGHAPQIETDAYGDPVVRANVHGVAYSIYFYGCTGGQDCLDLLFSVGFDRAEPLSLNSANSWNSEKLIGQVWIDEEGDPFLDLVVPGVMEMSPEGFARIVTGWGIAVDEFADFIGW